MNESDREAIAALFSKHEADLVGAWLQALKDEGALRAGRMKEAELASQCGGFLRVLRQGFDGGGGDADAPAFAPAREWLAELSRGRALQGYSPRETAVFVLSLKQPLFELLNAQAQLAPAARLQLAWSLGQFLDKLGILTMEAYQRTREEVIVRQEREIAELSTPVVKLWDGILALPLIGTLDSQRTQVVMQNLLESIVAQGATIAIVDITGVPTVDTLTAQHLLKTVQAARLMGADCIISGIRPQIAQTMVHLGVELSVVSKATLADAFAVALARRGRCVTRTQPAPSAAEPAGAAA